MQPHELIGIIASKGGTTQAALDVLTQNNVGLHLEDAMLAAMHRARELAALRG
jgi:pyrroline-5-carboxylate reductase